ncbi:MAG: DUF1959 family protein [Methanoregula sp.]|nr:MAG: DUF1959 family protein [Methanoregula sp.]
MTRWLHEQDLVAQKYRILIAQQHDHLVHTVASDLGISVQELRKYLIEHIDMILLENLPARYEAARAADEGDPVAQGLNRRILSTGIPLVPKHRMDEIFQLTKERIETGSPVSDAVAAGKAMIREVIRE